MSSSALLPINPTSVPAVSNTPPGSTNPDIQVTGAPPSAAAPTTNPSGKTALMLTPAGTKVPVAVEDIQGATADGLHLLVPMVTPAGNRIQVKMSDVHDAIKDGVHMDDPVINALSDNSGVKGVVSGFAEGATDSMRGISTIATGSPSGLGIPDVNTAPSGIAEKIGKGGESILEFMLGNEAFEGLGLGDKLAKIAPTIKALESHPALAKIVVAGIRGGAAGGVVGGAEGAIKGASTGNLADALAGAETGAEYGAAGGAVFGAAPAAYSATKSGLRQLVQGADAAQSPAQQAIRQAVQASADEAGTATDALSAGIQNQPILKGGQSLVDDHLSALKAAEQDAYDQMDEAAGFDVKDKKARLSNDQYKLKQLGNTDADIALKDQLNASIRDSQARIADAEAKMQEADIDPKAADVLHKQRMAGLDFKKALVRNTSEDGQTINVDKLLTASKNLRFTKYGDRLSQFFGSDEAADDFMSSLKQAQKAGAHAVRVRKVALWTAAALGVTGVGAKIIHGLAEEKGNENQNTGHWFFASRASGHRKLWSKWRLSPQYCDRFRI